MQNETRLTVRLPEDLLEAVKTKAEAESLTISSLIRNFFLDYISAENETLDRNSNSIYTYWEVAKKKRELKEAVKQAHEAFNETQRECANLLVNKRTGESIYITTAREEWKGSVAAYNSFCDECKKNKVDNNSKEN